MGQPQPVSSHSDSLHEYLHGVLESGDHGPHRHLSFDLPALNEAVERHAKAIAKHIESAVYDVYPKDRDEVRVSNNLGNVSFECTVATPRNLGELVQVMASAKRENRKVKAVGGFYAFSPLCETTGYLVKTDHLVGVSPITPVSLKDTKQATGLYNVLCGTKLSDLVLALEKDGRALMNLGGFTGQSVIGAMSTGTHGSGLTLPPLASAILSLHLVSAVFSPQTGLPIQYIIEPTNGITSPSYTLPASTTLIQNDKLFNAAVTSLGALGVVYSVTISTVPFYWIRETRKMIDWKQAKVLLEQGAQGSILGYHNAEVWVNPYTEKVLVTLREKVEEAGGEGSVSLFVTLLENLPALKEIEVALDEHHVVEDVSKRFGIILAMLLRHFPLLVPTAIDLAMDTQNHSQPKTAKYYDIYNIGSINDFPAISTEISYPMTSYISATDSTISLLQNLHKTNIFQAVTSPISLRFTASTPTSLSMSYARASSTQASVQGRCYMEMPSLYYFYTSVPGYEEISRAHVDQSTDMFQGRVHWGQYIPPSFTTLQYQAHDPDFYESIATFKAIVEEFDPEHTMENDFLTRVIWLVRKTTVLFPLPTAKS